MSAPANRSFGPRKGAKWLLVSELNIRATNAPWIELARCRGDMTAQEHCERRKFC
jgi:hypothetical protein